MGQIEQVDPPARLVAVFDGGQQVAVGGLGIDADEDGFGGLEDFVMSTHPHPREVFGVADGACLRNMAVKDIVDGAQAHLEIEEVPEQFADAAHGTVTDEGQGQDQLTQPCFRDGQIEQHLIVGRGLVKSAVQRGRSFGRLLVDKLATYAMGGGQLCERAGMRQSLQGQIAALRRPEPLRPKARCC